jgi:hypothetical protein
MKLFFATITAAAFFSIALIVTMLGVVVAHVVAVGVAAGALAAVMLRRQPRPTAHRGRPPHRRGRDERR